jgi:hypothetical protein
MPRRAERLIHIRDSNQQPRIGPAAGQRQGHGPTGRRRGQPRQLAPDDGCTQGQRLGDYGATGPRPEWLSTKPSLLSAWESKRASA